MEVLRRLFHRVPASTPGLRAAPERVRHLRYGQVSDVGRARDNNQDACLTLAACEWGGAALGARPGECDALAGFSLFIVADGMGGHQRGEQASSLAARVIAEYMADQAYLPMLTPGNHRNPGEGLMDALNDAIRAANAAVAEQVPDGGTTLTAAAIYDHYAYIAHVGDSRAYLIARNGADVQMQRLTRDHSLVQRLIELDQLTPEQAAEHPHRNVLYRAIGQSDHLELDNQIVYLPPASRLLLCSDGLWNMVPEPTIAEIVTAAAPQQACERLVAAANAQGGLDNITAVLIQLPG